MKINTNNLESSQHREVDIIKKGGNVEPFLMWQHVELFKDEQGKTSNQLRSISFQKTFEVLKS